MNNTPEKKKSPAKKSLFKSQVRSLIVIAAVIAVLAVAVAVTLAILNRTDGIIDTFTETKRDAQNGKVKYTYYSKEDPDGDGFIIIDVDGNVLENFYVDENGNPDETESETSTHVFETVIGSLLQLTKAGKITYFAMVDYGGDYIGGDTGCRVLMFPHTGQEEIASIFVHHGNEDGSITEFTVEGNDVDNDGYSDYFSIKGYEGSTMNQMLSAAMCSFAGYTLTMKKLAIPVMRELDELHKNDPDYEPLVDADGNIRFSEYGLEDTPEAAYYEITGVKGDKYRVYIGDKVPDGNGLYVRYYDESEGARNAVYKISDDPGISMAFGREISRTSIFLGRPEDLVYPQIVYPATMTTYLMPDRFRIEKLDPENEFAAADGYRKVIDFSYIDLNDRNYTLDQTHPYIVNDVAALEGYTFNDNVANDILLHLYSISSIMGADYSSTAVMGYVSVKELVREVISNAEFPDQSDYKNYNKYYAAYADAIVAAVKKTAETDTELAKTLEKYGLDKPAFRLFYDSMTYSGGVLVPQIPNYIWISEATRNGTYYVWAPLYQQIVEIGEQYLNILELDTYDWVTDDIFDTNIGFVDDIRISGMIDVTNEDGTVSKEFREILFELENSHSIGWNVNFVCSYGIAADITQSRFTLTADVDPEGKVKLTLGSSIKYTVKYRDPTTGETSSGTETHTGKFLDAVSLETVKNYCKYCLDEKYYSTLTEEEKRALLVFGGFNPDTAEKDPAKPTPNVTLTGGGYTVKVSFRIKDVGDDYGYIDSSVYVMTFTYDSITDNMTVSAKQDGSVESFVFDEKVFLNYYKKNVKNDGVVSFTESELEAIDSFYRSVTSMGSTQSRLRVKVFDESGRQLSEKVCDYVKADHNNVTEGNQYISAFKKFYQTMLYASFEGYATESETVAGKALTEEEMKAFRDKGDDCDVKITVNLSLNGIEYVYRMYNYSATKSYITVNGNGIFYILRNRTEKFMNDAVRAAAGDTTITGDGTY